MSFRIPKATRRKIPKGEERPKKPGTSERPTRRSRPPQKALSKKKKPVKKEPSEEVSPPPKKKKREARFALPKDVVCDQCGFATTTDQKLDDHVKRVHLNIRYFSLT